MQVQTVYIVKFDKGYYAKKQPTYEWCYTDDILEAYTWKSLTAAKSKIKHNQMIEDKSTKCIIEEYTVKSVMEFVK